MAYAEAYATKCLIENATFRSKDWVATINRRIVCLRGGLRGHFPFRNADFISKRGAALNSWLLCKTSAYAEAYAAKCLIEIIYFISEVVCLREAYAGKRFASK